MNKITNLMISIAYISYQPLVKITLFELVPANY